MGCLRFSFVLKPSKAVRELADHEVHGTSRSFRIVLEVMEDFGDIGVVVGVGTNDDN